MLVVFFSSKSLLILNQNLKQRGKLDKALNPLYDIKFFENVTTHYLDGEGTCKIKRNLPRGGSSGERPPKIGKNIIP
jgi:hypothetical protein